MPAIRDQAYELRRFMPRQFADWSGNYLVESDSETRWRYCRVVDISSAGAGLELREAPAQTAEGDRIFIAVHLQAEIRNVRPTPNGLVRAGTQFVNLTEAERVYLESQETLAVHW